MPFVFYSQLFSTSYLDKVLCCYTFHSYFRTDIFYNSDHSCCVLVSGEDVPAQIKFQVFQNFPHCVLSLQSQAYRWTRNWTCGVLFSLPEFLIGTPLPPQPSLPQVSDMSETSIIPVKSGGVSSPAFHMKEERSYRSRSNTPPQRSKLARYSPEYSSSRHCRHTHTHTHTHRCGCAHTHAHSHLHLPASIHTHTHTHMHACFNIHIHTQAYIHCLYWHTYWQHTDTAGSTSPYGTSHYSNWGLESVLLGRHGRSPSLIPHHHSVHSSLVHVPLLCPLYSPTSCICQICQKVVGHGG